MFPNLHHQSPPNFAVKHHLITSTSKESDTNKDQPNDGGSLEPVRRPRGRPPGSKNNLKPPVSVTKQPQQPCLSPYVLEVSSGSDIIATVTKFCNRRKTGLCVLSGTGSVSNVSIRQPTTDLVFRGRFSLLSISATILPPLSSVSTMLTTSTNSDIHATFYASFAGPKGQTFGGAVVGPLVASGTVYIVAMSFHNLICHQLPVEDEDDISKPVDWSVSAAVDHNPGSSDGDSAQHHAPALTTAELISMYGCHLSDDDIWAPTPQQPPPYLSLYKG